jgi:signal transduction histidine kinase
MHSLFNAISRGKNSLFLWMSIGLLACSYSCFAQFNPSFDSSMRAAMAISDPAVRLAKLRPLSAQSEASSVLQMISFGEAMLRAASEVQSDTDRYQAHLLLTSGYERNRNFEQSLSHGLQAAAIANKQKNYLNQIRVYQGVAFTYSSMGLMSGNKADMEKAFYYCAEALAISKAQGIKEEEPYILNTTADVYAMNSRYEEAISLYHQAIASRKEQGLGATTAIYTNLGIALDLNKDYDAALAAYDKADSLSRLQDDGDFFRMKIASNKAILFANMGRVRESELLAQEILTNARQTGAVDMQLDMVDHLRGLYRKQGRYKEALEYADSLAAIKERILTAEKTGQLAEMETRYEAGVKDEQIAGQKNTIKKNKQQNRIQWGGITLLFIVGGAAFIGLRRSRQLNRKITLQQQQLVLQKTELQRINEMKDQLFSLIGHDVRVPLNSLMAYATLLDQAGDLPPEKIRQYNADLRQTLGYTTVLMENLLQFAKTQMQAVHPNTETIFLSTAVNRAVRLFQPAMDQKRLVLKREFDESVTAFADEDMTEVILRNLLSNAIKFSAAGGAITISIEPQEDAFICCRVSDEGPGMKPELAALWNNEAVPTPIRSTLGTQHEKGAGLGLMLSKTFAVIMGGRMFVKSEPGKGAAVSLLLPREKTAV